jgi:hypothetical protein
VAENQEFAENELAHSVNSTIDTCYYNDSDLVGRESSKECSIAVSWVE